MQQLAEGGRMPGELLLGQRAETKCEDCDEEEWDIDGDLSGLLSLGRDGRVPVKAPSR